ncbi:MAG: 16S rRNA (cytosine(1402)-N(4))-methyltransferase, partial [Tenericutes bacterium HGW-Tenericutes-8]
MRNNLIQDFVKDYLSKHIKPDDVMIDATLGNGYDSEYLLGLGAVVFAFDIQLDAINHTLKRLGKPNALHIYHTSFIHMFDYVENFKGVIFNLGYLPSGDKQITTKASDTLYILKEIIQKMKDSTFILITAYPGHEAGQIEALEIERFIQTLSSDYLAYTYQIKNRLNAPYNII